MLFRSITFGFTAFVRHDMVLRLNSTSVTEGTGVGGKTVSLELASQGALEAPVCVWWHTENGTATGVDKPTLTDGTQDFLRLGVSKVRYALLQANAPLAKLALRVTYDAVPEDDETFQVVIDKATTQVAGRCVASSEADPRIKVKRGVGTITIYDDDTIE